MQTEIRLYYHVTQIHDWYDITKFIFDKIVSSGLSADMKICNVCALGDESELPKLRELISQYPKTELRYHNTNKSLWEMATMYQLKHDADTLPKHYQIYLHSKSVTYPPEGNGIDKTVNDKKYELFWRDYMIYAIVERWRDNYAALNMNEIGYDIAGCRIIPARKSASHTTHASGNMWMANSEYIKTLPKIEPELDRARQERVERNQEPFFYYIGQAMEAETWPWVAMPIIYISCNAFTEGFPSYKTFQEHLDAGYPIKEYSTDITHTL